MQKIGSILQNKFKNNTLKKVYFQHSCTKAIQDTFTDMGIEEMFSEIEFQIKDTGSVVDIFCSSRNFLLLTHLKLNHPTIEEKIASKLTTTKNPHLSIKLHVKSR